MLDWLLCVHLLCNANNKLVLTNLSQFPINALKSHHLPVNRRISIILWHHRRICGLGNSVGIATGYGLDGPGIESRWGIRFFANFQTGPGAHPASCTMGTGSFPGVKRPGPGADHPPHFSVVVEYEKIYTSTPL
jgi:hypothetical protein